MGTSTAAPGLAERVLSGDVRAVARAISVVEDESDASAHLISRLFPHTGQAYLIGVTGPPGAGKSTLVDRLTGQLREAGRTVGIVAVDPTSPFTGGAILGDRVRMQSHAADPGVFIRSMATRGNLGGLARATGDATIVLDASGRDIIIVETVGVGQDEVDIVRTADVSIVVLVPGTGDEVQALKAGIMEIADIFVVNKADREGADRTAAGVEGMLSLESSAPGEWRPPILKTEATTGAGVPALVEAIERFRRHAPEQLGRRRRARSEFRLRELLAARFMARVDVEVGPAAFAAMVDQITSRTLDPYSAARDIIERLAPETPGGSRAGGPHPGRNGD
jgi:LAO/AO transport system kinase